MFDIGFWELLLIAIVALLVIGPDRLPRMARDVGRWIGQMRRYLNSVRADFEREIAVDEFNKSLKDQELQRAIKAPTEILSEATGALRQQTTELVTAVKGDAVPAVAPSGTASGGPAPSAELGAAPSATASGGAAPSAACVTNSPAAAPSPSRATAEPAPPITESPPISAESPAVPLSTSKPTNE